MKLNRVIRHLFFYIFISFVVISCKKEDSFDTNSKVKLSIRNDTVFFDTVFTTLRTVTKRFVIHNNDSKSLKISQIILGGGPFRLNIDGQPGTQFSNYTILPKDSFYVFVDATIDPNNQNNPFIVKDSILFVTNGNIQKVMLIAWGRNAHYLRDSVLTGNITWPADKPYVIFNSIGINQNSSLTISAGTKIYSNGGSGIFVWGTMTVNGNKANPVLFTGIRQEDYYKDIPGQWYGIRLLPGSKDNSFTYCSIMNATVGIEVDSIPVDGNPNLVLDKVKIENMSAIGLLGYTAKITCYNVLIDNCCQGLFVGSLGGIYNIYQSTFANSSVNCFNQNPGVSFDNGDYTNGTTTIPNPLNINIINSIIWGSNSTEISIQNVGKGLITAAVNYTLIETNVASFNNSALNNVINQDPLFVSVPNYNYELDTLSPAIGRGTPMSSPTQLQYDLEGNPRPTSTPPDLGALQRVK